MMALVVIDASMALSFMFEDEGGDAARFPIDPTLPNGSASTTSAGWDTANASEQDSSSMSWLLREKSKRRS